MSEKPSAKVILKASSILSPFDNEFDPTPYSKGKSHFQLAFFFITNSRRREALHDFYAFCRLVDDLADEESLDLQDRRRALEQIRNWLISPTEAHPYWDRLRSHFNHFSIPIELPLRILGAVERDLKRPVRFESWDELNTYVQGVACDVGESVLFILGARGEQQSLYAQNMGRCAQYLNFMRDLEEDLKNNRIYLPREFFTLSEFPGAEEIVKAKNEFYSRALAYRRQARPYHWRCFPAELMVNLYIAASKLWRKGSASRLSRIQKLRVLITGIFQSFAFFKKSSI